MRRDTIFYQLFRQSSSLLFDLISQPPEDADRYVFESIEVKETAFRMDGVFLPPDRFGLIYFAEVQFQLDELLYERMLSEISIYTYRNREQFADWRAVAIYPSRQMEQSNLNAVVEMLASGRITPIYLDELGMVEELPVSTGMMVLTTLEGDDATQSAISLIQRAQGDRGIIDVVSTIMVYKFSNLSRDEVDAMLGIELQQTRVYQEARAEGETIGEVRGEARGEAKGLERGRTEGEQALVLKLLIRKLGKINPQLRSRISSLKIEQVESLGEALLDFTSIADLEAWLSQN
jgi:predicted transposase/invertase (TIGR01784 family)